MTLTFNEGQRSRSNFPKMGKKLKNWLYLLCYFTYRLHTWYQGTTYLGAFNDSRADDLDLHTVKVKGQGQNFPKMGKTLNNWPPYFGSYFLQTSYLVPRYNQIRHIQRPNYVPMTLTERSRFFGQGQMSLK